MEATAAMAVLTETAAFAMLSAVTAASLGLSLALSWACINGLVRWAARGVGPVHL